MRITVSIVEDNRGTRENLKAVLDCAPGLRCLDSYSSGEEAIRGITKNIPDVVLMDIQLPGINGIQCVAQLKSKLPKLQVLMLTTYEDSDLIFESLRAGANGYLLKKMEPSEMIHAIEQVHAGGSPMSMHIARKVVNYFQQSERAPSKMEQLTNREHEILVLLAKGQAYKEIAEHLCISVNTVRVHLHSVYEKLHVQSRTEAVVKFLQR
jgi:DNA-binding NarL/FixJ family response regulator